MIPLARAIGKIAEENKKSASFRKRISFGKDKRDRTADLLNAIQALSQAVRVHTPITSAWETQSIWSRKEKYFFPNPLQPECLKEKRKKYFQ